MTPVDTRMLREIAEREFADIVLDVILPDLNELRIIVTDGSFIDIWFSLKLSARYNYHWEQRAVDGSIYRHDNAPHKHWASIETFPRHFHNGTENRVERSNLSLEPVQALRQVLTFVRAKLRQV